MTIYIIEMLGVAVFAISGGLAAGRKGLDGVGVLALAVVTSLGGGTIRDIMLRRDFVFWIHDPTYLWVILSATFVTVVYVKFFKPPLNALLIADALGLAFFSILGAQIAESMGVSAIIIVVMGMITGVAGGVIRDILTSEIPLIFKPTETLYSVAALGGVVIYLVLANFGLNQGFSSILGISTVAIIRFSAIFWKIRLPAFHLPNIS